MTKWEFMRKLEELLLDISPIEREEALQYYNDYINDAGKENESEAIASLGTPEQVAAIVKGGLDGGGQGMFTEQGYVNKEESSDNTITRYGDSKNQKTQTGETGEQKQEEPKKKQPLSTGTIILLVILGIFASPILIGAAGTLFGLLISIAAVILSLMLVVVILTVVFFAASIVLIITGITSLIVLPYVGLAMIGVGCLLFSLSILFLLLTIAVCGKLVPAMFRGVVSLFQKIFYRREGARA